MISSQPVLSRKKALMVVAREVQLRHFKSDLWIQACRMAQLQERTREKTYARLRYIQLVSGDDKPEEKIVSSTAILIGLRCRAEEFWWESSLIMAMVSLCFLASVRMLA